MYAVWFALVVPASAQTWPAGETIPDAASVHVTKGGFSAVAGLIPSLVPTDPVPVDPTGDAGGFGCVNYAYTLTDAWVGLQATGAEIVPRTDALDVKLHLDVWINDPTDKFLLNYELFCSETDCPGYVDTFPVTATVPFVLKVVDGPDGLPMLDAVMGEIAIENGLVSDDIHLDCNIDDMETVLNFFGLSIYELIIGLAEDQIAAQLEDQRAELEATLEEALAAARIDTTTDVGGIPLHLALHPRTVDVSDAGLALGMQGLAEAPSIGCVDAFDPGGSLRTDGAAPGVADDPSGAHLGLLASDDFVDQALYALWRGGLLCYDVTDSADVPIDLTTSLLGVVGGDRMKELWPEDGPMIVFTEPRKAPVVSYAGDHDLTVVVDDLGIEFLAELDYRTVHALGVALDVDAGVDVTFDGATGAAAVAVDVGEGAIVTRVASNEFAPGAEAQIVDSFGGLVDSLMGSLLGDALGGLAFSVPPFAEGLGLTSLELQPAGDGTWLGAWAGLGPVTYTGDAEGCGGGCANGAGGGGFAGLILAAALARRRSR